MKRLALLLLACCASAASAQAPPEIHFVPIHPTVSDRVTILVEGTGCTRYQGRREIRDNRITLEAELIESLPCGPGQWAFEYQPLRLAEGRYVVEVKIDGQTAAERELVIGPVTVDDQALFLDAGNLGTQFTALLEWTFPGVEVPLRAYAVDVSHQAGYFWFFSPDNPEVAVKLLDGTAVNGHGWFFISSLTTVPFTLTLTGCLPNVSPPLCNTRTYDHPGGLGELIVDFTVD